MDARRLAAYVWAGPNTVLGLGLAGLVRLTGGQVTVVEGVVEAGGGVGTWLLRRAIPLPDGAQAITLGHVVLGQNRQALERTRRHERIHVRQYERWGPLFLPAYVGASALRWAQGRDPYRENPFEIEAFASGTSTS